MKYFWLSFVSLLLSLFALNRIMSIGALAFADHLSGGMYGLIKGLILFIHSMVGEKGIVIVFFVLVCLLGLNIIRILYSRYVK